MTKRALYVGQRVTYSFWNEKVRELTGRGRENPFMRHGTILEVGHGKALVDWDATRDKDILATYGGKHAARHTSSLPCYMLDREGTSDAMQYVPPSERNKGAIYNRLPRKRPKQWYMVPGFFMTKPTQEEWVVFRHRVRDNRSWEQWKADHADLARRAKEHADNKRLVAYLQERLRTPYDYPHECPVGGCPVYPGLNAAGNGLDGFRCRTHGDVTPEVMARYYPPARPVKAPRKRARK